MTDDDELDGWAVALIPVLNEYARLNGPVTTEPSESSERQTLLTEMETAWEQRLLRNL